jgi:hypothetical protein
VVLTTTTSPSSFLLALPLTLRARTQPRAHIRTPFQQPLTPQHHDLAAEATATRMHTHTARFQHLALTGQRTSTSDTPGFSMHGRNTN